MKNIIITLLTVTLLAGISSCMKDKQDSPPTGGTDPNIPVNFSVDSLIARCAANNGNPVQITQPLVISGVVVADDSSGTFYKELDIEDSTSGIMLMIDGTYLYNLYPVGTRLFIKLQGLYIVYTKGAYEIVAIINSGGTYTGIPSTVAPQYIFPGKWGINVPPKVVTIDQLNSSGNTYISELVQLNNVQFTAASQNVPYVNSNVSLRDCNGESNLEVYTSSYSDFANLPTPTGNGTFIGIYSIYVSATSGRATNELLIRTPQDLNMNGTLCP